VELPPNIFNDLTEDTVEAWVRWDDFRGPYKRAFNYGDALQDVSITTRADTANLWFVLGDTNQVLHGVEIPNVLPTQQWTHVAAVSGPRGAQLYLNGALVGTNEYTGSFAALGNGRRFRLGQTVTSNDLPTSFKGGIDEVRVWRGALGEDQILAGMFQPLVGNEPGLAAVWNFDRVENDVVRDSGPGGHHGKIIGPARASRCRTKDQA
jgi:hypothetical protein